MTTSPARQTVASSKLAAKNTAPNRKASRTSVTLDLSTEPSKNGAAQTSASVAKPSSNQNRTSTACEGVASGPIPSTPMARRSRLSPVASIDGARRLRPNRSW
jgi:hypothetical protein